MTTFFQPQDVSSVLDDFLSSLNNRLFGNGAPERPNALALEQKGAPSASTPTATSLGLSLTATAFATPPIHVPNGGDGAFARHSYKSELTLVKDPGVCTQKILWWHTKDPREIPHNHPWDFRSAVLRGGYTEERFWLDDSGRLQRETLRHAAGDVNTVPANVYHNVIHVEPGTVTFLDCGPARPGNQWGYLDLSSLEHLDFTKVTPANLKEIFAELNPHTIPKPKTT